MVWPIRAPCARRAWPCSQPYAVLTIRTPDPTIRTLVGARCVHFARASGCTCPRLLEATWPPCSRGFGGRDNPTKVFLWSWVHIFSTAVGDTSSPQEGAAILAQIFHGVPHSVPLASHRNPMMRPCRGKAVLLLPPAASKLSWRTASQQLDGSKRADIAQLFPKPPGCHDFDCVPPEFALAPLAHGISGTTNLHNPKIFDVNIRIRKGFVRFGRVDRTMASSRPKKSP